MHGNVSMVQTVLNLEITIGSQNYSMCPVKLHKVNQQRNSPLNSCGL